MNSCNGLISKVCILSVIYHEPEWAITKACIEESGLPVHYVERNPKGVGSLAEAINRGFKECVQLFNPDYVWVVTNITFNPSIPKALISALDSFYPMAAVHPCFKSDHAHLQQQTLESHEGYIKVDVPFVEFTAPMVRVSVFDELPLDEKMPYVGHDMAWGYEVRQKGYCLGVYHGEQIGHTYIRHNKNRNAYTQKRSKLRRAAVKSTIERLIQLYGPDYKNKIKYHNNL